MTEQLLGQLRRERDALLHFDHLQPGALRPGSWLERFPRDLQGRRVWRERQQEDPVADDAHRGPSAGHIKGSVHVGL